MSNIALRNVLVCFLLSVSSRARTIIIKVLVDLPMWMADLQFFTILGRFIDLPYLCGYK